MMYGKVLLIGYGIIIHPVLVSFSDFEVGTLISLNNMLITQVLGGVRVAI
jgi:hypothetical protein